MARRTGRIEVRAIAPTILLPSLNVGCLPGAEGEWSRTLRGPELAKGEAGPTTLKVRIMKYVHRLQSVSNPKKRYVGISANLQERLKQWLDQAGLDGRISARTLRHTLAARLLGLTGHLRLVQQALGHRSIASTIRYTQVPSDALVAALETI